MLDRCLTPWYNGSLGVALSRWHHDIYLLISVAHKLIPIDCHFGDFLLVTSMPSVLLQRGGEASLEEAGRAGQLGHTLQTGDDGPSGVPEYLSSLQSFNIPPSSFDAPFGRVGYVLFCGREKKDAIVLFCCSIYSPCRAQPHPHLVWSSFSQQLCGLAWCSTIANLQMCLPLLSGVQVKCSGLA